MKEIERIQDNLDFWIAEDQVDYQISSVRFTFILALSSLPRHVREVHSQFNQSVNQSINQTVTAPCQENGDCAAEVSRVQTELKATFTCCLSLMLIAFDKLCGACA